MSDFSIDSGKRKESYQWLVSHRTRKTARLSPTNSRRVLGATSSANRFSVAPLGKHPMVCLRRELRKQRRKPPPNGSSKQKEEYRRDVENPERVREREIEKARTEFSAFIRQVWFPICICDGEHKPTTIDFNRNISNVIADYFSGKAMQAISGTDIQKYLIYLRTGYRTAQGKPLAQKTIRHHYCTLANIFSYALKQEFILKNPMDKVDCPKLTKKRVEALTAEQARQFFPMWTNHPLISAVC